jgi:hypothetical protein
MTEQELRALVRHAIAKHAAAQADPQPARATVARLHPSHALVALPVGADTDDGVCIIEPAVACNHCGYCKSVGH